MRTRITMIICLCLLFAGRASAQWVVSDPGNLAQGIINASFLLFVMNLFQDIILNILQTFQKNRLKRPTFSIQYHFHCLFMRIG